eukprot:TRINITY_DN1275_c0_g2_i1.p1 TRINITY_DN1275_c0_g2~~TRINITY_DN1275_c0_g2_i1.p1  ORF type:complete len:340 (-),score=99.48 TRINITY_DN1275_c0_g2_i1:83-1102(-)
MGSGFATNKLNIWKNILGIFICFILYFLVQESVFASEGFEFGGFATWIQAVLYSLYSVAERIYKLKYSSDPEQLYRRAPLSYHATLAVLTVSGVGLGSYAIQLLNFPTWVLFKSSRVVAVMLGGILILRKQYTRQEYLGVAMLFVGLVTFSIGDIHTDSTFSWLGIVLVTAALASDAMLGNFQEKAFRTFKCSKNELLVYPYSIGCVLCLAFLVLTGELFDAVAYSARNPGVLLSLLVGNTLGYVGITFVYSLLEATDAVFTTVITSCRKAITIVLSFMIYSKPFAWHYALGGFLVFCGAFVNSTGKHRTGVASPHAHAHGPLLPTVQPSPGEQPSPKP